MKNARPIQDEASAPGTGAGIVASGAFPNRANTVAAEVLARLLSGERLTGLDAVTDASTTRLAAFVDYLQSAYSWRISRADRAVGCADGRVSTVSVYFLPPEAIETAMKAGAAVWCADVRAARLALRAKAAEAKQAAATANAARKARQQPQQGDLFGGTEA